MQNKYLSFIVWIFKFPTQGDLMSFQPGAMAYVQSAGSSPMSVAYPHLDVVDPPTTQTNFPIGKRWINTLTGDEFVLTSIDTTGGVFTANWSQGGNQEATTDEFGIVQLATLAELQNGNAPAGAYVPTSNDVATVIAGVVVGAVPPATEIQQGIAELATQVETDAGVDDTKIVTPLKLANFVASGGFPGVFTDLTATGTISFTGATGTGFDITAAAASTVDVSGAGIDLTLASAAGRVVVNGEEAAADAVRILSAAGGLDVDVALQMNLTSSQNAVDAVRILASAGGIDIDAVGAATEDINITNTGGSIRLTATENVTDAINIEATVGGVNILASGAAAGEDINITATGSSVNLTSTEDAALAIYLHANGGTSETIRLRSDQGTSATSIDILSDAGGVALTGGSAAATAISLTTTNAAGGVTMTAGTGGILPTTTGAFTVVSTANAANAIELHANGGVTETIRLRSDQGTAVTSIDVLSDVGGITLTAGLGTADAINITTSNAAGGIDIDAGTAGIIADTTGAISLDSAAASNFTVTGAFDLTVASSLGSVNISAGEAAADAINVDSTGGIDVDAALQINVDSSQAAATAVRINASNAAGGIDIDAGTGGIAVDSTGAISIDGAAASNLTVTGAGIDLTLASVGGSVLVDSTENAALAIRLHANGGTAETIQLHSDQGTGVSSIGLLSDVGGITLTATGLASADAINLEAPAGGIDMDSALATVITSSQAAATAIQLTASDAAGGINLTSGTGNVSVTGGHLSIATVAKTLLVNGGAETDFIGTGTLVAGTKTIANTNIATGDVILLARGGVNASTTLGMLQYTISAGASFTVNSLIVGTPGSVQTNDVSDFTYFIVRPT